MVIFSILITGCVSQKSNPDTTGNIDVPPTQVQSRCLQSGNTTPHIFINFPKGNHHLGDVFEINGTTNLGNDEEIDVSISGIVKSSPYPSPSSPSNLVGSFGPAKVLNITCGEKNWTYLVNTSEFNTAFYIVDVGARNWTVRNVSNFELIMGR
jgi:hypothetical protein